MKKTLRNEMTMRHRHQTEFDEIRAAFQEAFRDASSEGEDAAVDEAMRRTERIVERIVADEIAAANQQPRSIEVREDGVVLDKADAADNVLVLFCLAVVVGLCVLAWRLWRAFT